MTDYNSTFRNTGSAGSTGSDAGNDLEQLRKDIAKLTETVTGVVKSQADAASATVKDALDTAKGSIATTAQQASDRVTSLGAELEATIERNPLTAVLVALSVGLVAGMLSHSRR